MSLLDVAQSVAVRVGVNKPSTLFNSQDKIANQLQEFIKQEAKFLLNKFDWQAITTEATFVTQAVENQGALTALFPNFKKVVNDTMWNRSLGRPVLGALASRDYERNKSWAYKSIYTKYRFQGGNLLMHPVPAAGQNIYLIYVNTLSGFNQSGTAISTLGADTDTFILDEELLKLGVLWRFKHAKGLDYAQDKLDAEAMMYELMEQEQVNETVRLDASYNRVRGDGIIPDGNWNL